VPASVAAVIDRCLLKRPDDRFATGEELADALGKAIGAVEQEAREGNNASVISSEAAMAVWRRAAELQAEAASRLETRMRETMASERVKPVPTDAYRVRDVEAAAAEVGISQRYVALALAEMGSTANALQRVQPVPAWKERLATRVLGTAQRTLSVSRVMRFAPRVVLQSVGRVFQSMPFALSLRDTIGGHPLDGGVLVFNLPPMGASDYRWTWTRYGVYVPEIRATFATVAGDARACEVTLHVDLRRGITANLAAYGVISGTGATLGGLFGGVAAYKALAFVGAALLGPVVGAAAVTGLAVAACAGPIYRWEIGKTAQELEAALAAVETGIRAMDIFGEAPPPRHAPPQDMSYLTGM
jgi:hypothetical protein